MRVFHFVIFATMVIGQTSATVAQVVPGPGYMVWQQGMNGSAEWQRLGCPRAYASDDEKEEMIRRGECRNARSATMDRPSTHNGGTAPAPLARPGTKPSGPPAGGQQP